eukprot:maker-scaffold993_size72668-snap-gene-0.19 protein:Tk11420 transcript:maker-scaffold993_size72668-snap-gene-0.19-mRNA-1 annotation:"long-chain-fatty-acid-- ligase"
MGTYFELKVVHLGHLTEFAHNHVVQLGVVAQEQEGARNGKDPAHALDEEPIGHATELGGVLLLLRTELLEPGPNDGPSVQQERHEQKDPQCQQIVESGIPGNHGPRRHGRDEEVHEEGQHGHHVHGVDVEPRQEQPATGSGEQDQQVRGQRVFKEGVDEHVQERHFTGRDPKVVIEHVGAEGFDEHEVGHEDAESGDEQSEADQGHGLTELQATATVLHDPGMPPTKGRNCDLKNELGLTSPPLLHFLGHHWTPECITGRQDFHNFHPAHPDQHCTRMEVVCLMDRALSDEAWPVGLKVIEYLERVNDKLSGLKLDRSTESSLGLLDRSMEIYSRNGDEPLARSRFHLVLFRTYGEVGDCLSDAQVEQWHRSMIHRDQRPRVDQLTLLVYDLPAAKSSVDKFQMATQISRAELRFDFQVMLSSPKSKKDELDQAANFLHCYLKALLKKRPDLDVATLSLPSKCVKVDIVSKSGLRKLWLQQVMQVCPPRTKQGIHAMADPVPWRQRLLAGHDPEPVGVAEKRLHNLLTNADGSALL